MAKREVLGVMPCPECGHDSAEVKAQKNGLCYRYCPECNAQYFPRTEDASNRLLAKVGKTPVPETETKATPEAKTVPAKEPAKPAQKGSTFANALELLGVK